MSDTPERRLGWRGNLSRYVPADGSEARETWPFLVIVTAALALLYWVALSGRADLHEPLRLAAFTILMVLYLASFLVQIALQGRTANPRWPIAMLAVQTVLAVLISVIAQNLAVSFGVFAPLIGITVGTIRNRLTAAVAVLILLALSVFSALSIDGIDGLLNWLVVAIPLTLFVVVYVLLFMRQAEARAEAQRLLAELETAHEQLAEYAVQVEDLTLASERQRMARELHDTLAQGLAGLILQLEAAKSQLEAGRTTRTGEIIDQAMVRARATLGEARQAIGDLRNTEARSEDLGLAVRREVDRFSMATGIPCALQFSLSVTLPQRATEHAVRIVSEALSNVAQHAEADQVWVSVMQQEEDQIVITVRDDGVGFDVDGQQFGTGHFGLVGMRERARLADGTLDVVSAPGIGTTVQLDLRVPTEEVDDSDR